MPDAPEPFEDLMSHARQTRVVVVGGGIAGLVAAWECAKVGMPVTVVEASDSFGGTIAGADVAGIRLDVGATCWSAGGAVRELVEELGLAERVVTPDDDRTWIAGLPRGAAAVMPRDTVLGIPANAWDAAVRPFIGARGAWRAYVDRLRPPLTIGKQLNLARLVRTRMGDAVLERMVAPLSIGRFGVAPDLVDVSVAAPGLSSALTRTGSLGGAVADLLVGRDGPAVESLEGGLVQLVEALVARLEDLGAELYAGRRVESIERAGDDRWRVVADLDDAGAVDGEVVIVATGPSDAARLLAPLTGTAVTEMTLSSSWREIVTLVVDSPALDSAPRGAEVFAVPGTVRASGLVHATARWKWLAGAAGAGRHVLHVAFDRHPGDPALPTGDELAALARDAASTLLGVEIDATAVRGRHHAVFPLPLPASAIGHADHAATVRAAVGSVPGLAAVGGWLAGSGLAQVFPDAREEAERVRRAALWGRSGAE